MIDFDVIKGTEKALYLNFPFCKTPCSYCHYIDNIKFGYTKIPENYIKILLSQLEYVLKNFKGEYFDSIYFGGGTPSLLSDKQCSYIKFVFEKNNIKASEISIEIHPGMCNFDYANNNFFTRYSIGVQSFSKSIKKTYGRQGYSYKDIFLMIKKIRYSTTPKIINIDIIFEKTIKDIDILTINQLKPDTVTFYPNTKGRGTNRLYSILNTLNKIKNLLKEYHPLGKSQHIFIRNNGKPSNYSKLEYEKNGNIIGLGHNSVSYIGKNSFLCKYTSNNGFFWKLRSIKENRFLISLMMGLSSGVRKKSVLMYYPSIYKNRFLYSVKNDIDVLDKHLTIQDDDLVYIPEEEYIRFYEYLIKEHNTNLAKVFLQSIGFGDSDVKCIYSIYNENLRISDKNLINLKNLLSTSDLKKIKTPSINILIEGIDGSGKDTFAQFLVKELKKRFKYDINSRISITGEPMSMLCDGYKAKDFIENIQYEGNSIDVKNFLINNRIASEKYISHIGGITILVRGLLTDKATYKRVFGTDTSLGEGKIIKLWDWLIIVDSPVSVANERIEKRGIPRTWREIPKHLSYFRKYYLSYESQYFRKKVVIINNNLNHLQIKANEMADEIYVYATKKI